MLSFSRTLVPTAKRPVVVVVNALSSHYGRLVR